MTRPFVWTLFFMIAGIIIGGQSVSMMHFALFTIIILSALMGYYFKSKIPIVFVLFFLLGNILIANKMQVENEMINQEVNITGVVTDTAYTSSGRQKITVKAECIETEMTQKTKSFKILAILPENETVSLWDTVVLKGTLLA